MTSSPFNCLPVTCSLLDGPLSGLTLGTDGELYGVTAYLGAYGHGNIFKTDVTGALTSLYDFCKQAKCPDGADPQGGLVQATDGNFYGTTLNGGAYGYGTVFRITPQGAFNTIYSFANGADGSGPCSTLVQGRSGDLYGTTKGDGTIFKITLEGALTTLHTFNDFSEGSDPYAGIIEGANGDFYGTTVYGGTNSGGTVFKMTPDGEFTTHLRLLRSKRVAKAVSARSEELVQATDGNLYGTTARRRALYQLCKRSWQHLREPSSRSRPAAT